MERTGDELLPALVGDADDGRVGVEELDDGPRDRIERGVEREALRERPGDLVQRAELLRRLALGGEDLLELRA